MGIASSSIGSVAVHGRVQFGVVRAAPGRVLRSGDLRTLEGESRDVSLFMDLAGVTDVCLADSRSAVQLRASPSGDSVINDGDTGGNSACNSVKMA